MLPTRYLELITLFFYCLRLDNWRAVDYAVISSHLASDNFRVSCRWINHKADSSDAVLDIQ